MFLHPNRNNLCEVGKILDIWYRKYCVVQSNIVVNGKLFRKVTDRQEQHMGRCYIQISLMVWWAQFCSLFYIPIVIMNLTIHSACLECQPLENFGKELRAEFIEDLAYYGVIACWKFFQTFYWQVTMAWNLTLFCD